MVASSAEVPEPTIIGNFMPQNIVLSVQAKAIEKIQVYSNGMVKYFDPSKPQMTAKGEFEMKQKTAITFMNKDTHMIQI